MAQDRVLVIGGGAAGLMAAGRAAELGASVLVTEKTGRLGQKVRLTGGGHGNLAHAGALEDWLTHVGPAAPFVRPTALRFGVTDLRAFFAAHGLPTVAEEDGRVFPASRNAHDIVRTLRHYCLGGRVQFRFDSSVDGILVRQGSVRAVRTAGKEITAGAVVLATGGASYPETGSSGDGYRLAAGLGHTVTPLRPGLVPLRIAEPWIRDLEGISLRNVSGTLERRGRAMARASGDILFTAEGISGPLAFTLSLGLAYEGLGLPVDVVLRLIPKESMAASGEPAMAGRVTAAGVLRTWLPGRLVQAVLALVGVDPAARFAALSRARRLAVWQRASALRLTVAGTAPVERAMVTVGGVHREEIDPDALASRLVRGLYLAGEVIDVAGDTGGYNLHLALATGYVAGESAARWVQRGA